MKKILLSVLMLVSSIGMFAVNYTNELTIAMSDGTYFPNLIIAESNDAEFAGGALVNGYFAPVQDLASAPLSVYAYYNADAYENLVLNDFTNVPMGIKTSSATTYTLYFIGLNGSFTIYDAVADQTIDCTSAYQFTITDAEKNSVINDRFVIRYVAPVQGICFKYNKLFLTKYDGATVEVFADGAATAALTQVVAGDAEFEIDLNAQASGKYKVVISGIATPEEYIIDVKPAVTVVP